VGFVVLIVLTAALCDDSTSRARGTNRARCGARRSVMTLPVGLVVLIVLATALCVDSTSRARGSDRARCGALCRLYQWDSSY